MKKLLSIFLCLVLLLALVPANAAADIHYQVIKAAVTVAAPKDGARPSFSAAISGSGYSVTDKDDDGFTDGVLWSDVTEGRTLTANDTFEPGHVYKVSVRLTAASGYTFDGGSCKINGNAAERTPYMSKVEYSYTFGPVAEYLVRTVNVTVTAPQAGEHPSYKVTVPEGVHYHVVTDYSDSVTLNGVFWIDCDEFASMTQYGLFTAGTEYRVCVILVSDYGYDFPRDAGGNVVTSSIRGFVNGSAASYISGVADHPDWIGVQYTFKADGSESGSVIIDAVEIVDFTPPLVGVPWKYTDTSKVTTEGVSWPFIRVEDSKGKYTVVSDNNELAAGESYTLYAYLKAAEGYTFKTKADGSPDVKVTVNGVEREAGSMADEYLVAAIPFVASGDNIIKSIEITDFTDPVPGITWTPESGSTLLTEGLKRDTWRINDANGKSVYSVVEGETYELYVRYDILDGYRIISKADGSPDVACTINGEPARVEFGSYDHTEILVCRDFTVPGGDLITRIDVTNCPFPSAGDQNFSLGSKIKITEGISIGAYGLVINGASGWDPTKLVAGESCTLILHVKVEDGYALKKNGDGSLAITATVNGKEVEAYLSSAQGIGGVGDEVSLYVPFTVSGIVREDIPKTGTAYERVQEIELDGEKITMSAYALLDENGYPTNYVRLRDLAYLLRSTAASFDVLWSAEAGITVVPKHPYDNKNGTEGNIPFTGNQPYEAYLEDTAVGSQAVPLTAFKIEYQGGGHTYYKLRDLGNALGFNVGWSKDRGIFIESEKPYDPAN